MKRILILAATVCALACHHDAKAPDAPSHGMSISSSAFAPNGQIPAKYGCSGQSISPPLTFDHVPPSAKTLALLVEDPDAPGKLFTHWVVWNIPPMTGSVGEGQPPGGTQGTNSYGKIGYGTLCPPSGEHRYVFRLFALDTDLSIGDHSGRDDLLQAMHGHIVAEAQLIGRYRR
jgi:Raf kinase inhibitor-like YbhB/YbcL family protein